MSQQPRLNTQRSGHHTTHVPNVNEITFVGQQWQSITPRYYIPKVISTHCWVLYFKTNSYFESNHNIFKIRVQPTTKLIEITMQLGMKTFTLI